MKGEVVVDDLEGLSEMEQRSDAGLGFEWLYSRVSVAEILVAQVEEPQSDYQVRGFQIQIANMKLVILD